MILPRSELVNDISFALKKIPRNRMIFSGRLLHQVKQFIQRTLCRCWAGPDAGGIFLLSRSDWWQSKSAITEGLSADKALGGGGGLLAEEKLLPKC